MNKNNLILEMGIFFILVLGIFTYIVIYEKKDIILKPKVEEKLTKYINENYDDIKDEIKTKKIKYNKKTDTYYIKIVNTKNKNLSFKVSFHNKKIKSTYKKDYQQGESLYKYLKLKTEKEIINKTQYKSSISFIQNLDKFTTTSKNKIISSNDLKNLSIYNLSTTIKTKNFTEENITKLIKEYYKQIIDLEYQPKEYEFIIINNKDKKINTSIKISKLNDSIIEENLDEIISSVLNNDEKIKDKYKIDYDYIY